MKIKNYDLNNELILEIGRFSVLWNCFERSQCSNNCSPRQIKAVCQNLCIDKDKINELAKVINTRREIFNVSISDYVQDGLHPEAARSSNPKEKELINIFLEQREGDSTVGCLLAINRIRNNLMHGLKQIEDLNNQLDLFRAVNEVLESVKDV